MDPEFGYQQIVEEVEGEERVTGMEDSYFGEVRHVVIHDEKGEPLYDTVVRREGPVSEDDIGPFPGPIVIPYRTGENLEIGMVNH
ncbi:MAG: hypothetical protein ABEJ56_04125 [Candidatus Nanohaloarchaea archaeon]